MTAFQVEGEAAPARAGLGPGRGRAGRGRAGCGAAAFIFAAWPRSWPAARSATTAAAAAGALAILKKAMVFCRSSAWLESCSEVAETSSEAAAFCW